MWHVVVNRAAGTTPVDVESLRRAAEDSGLSAEFHPTGSIEEMRALVDDVVRAGATDFVAVGGDGTVHALVNAIKQSDPELRPRLGLVPSGSGSDLMRTFAIARAPAEALRALVDPTPYPVDLGVISHSGGERWFINVMDVGVAAGAVRIAERMPRWVGRAKYVGAFWLHLASAPLVDVEVQVDHHQFTGTALNVVVANGQFFGGGLNVAPRASMNDGIFDVQVFTGPKRAAFNVMPRVIRGGHLTHRSVRRYLGSEVKIRSAHPLPVEADGELVGQGDVEIRMVRSGIDLVI